MGGNSKQLWEGKVKACCNESAGWGLTTVTERQLPLIMLRLIFDEFLRRMESMRTFNLIFRASTIALLTLVVLFGGTVRESAASVSLGDKLSLFGDFRFRYELDFRKNAGVKTDRDRARIRARFGFKYDWSKNVSFGMRLRTESDNNQSPHQTLGILGTADNSQFGLDRAHIDIKFMDGGFLWLGKHGMSFWQQNEAFWDGDIQPEGAGLGYKTKLGETGSLLVQSVHTYLNDNGTSDGHGIFEDDFGDSIQAVFTGASGDLGYTLAIGALFVTEQAGGGVPGGSGAYGIISAQLKTKISQFPIKFGVDYLYSDYDAGEPSLTDDSSGADDDNEGFVINLAAKYKKYGFKIEYYYIQINSVPLQGALAQDDFPFSSNFRGFKFQVSRDIGKGFNVDLRAYPQSRIDNAITAPAGGYVMGIDDVTRYQVNLNIKF